VPIYEVPERQNSFSPEEVTLGNVFDDVLGTLGLVNRPDPLTFTVAKRLFELATGGVRDPERLKHLTIQAFSEP